MAQSSDDRNPVERLAEEFLERHRRGEHPPLTEYLNRHPQWAAEIRELFPALVMMERLKPAPADVTGFFVKKCTHPAWPQLRSTKPLASRRCFSVGVMRSST